MSAHPKLTDEQVAFVRDIISQRRAAVEVVRQYPTNAQIAEQIGCTERYVEKISNGHARMGPAASIGDGPSDYSRLSEDEKAKAIARGKANMAQFRGKLVPRPCEKCGAKDVQKHHDDYSKPLEVRWLCLPCHRAEHQTTARPNIEQLAELLRD